MTNTTHRTRHPLTRIVIAAAALAVLIAVVAGLPWALLRVVGNPLTGLPHLTDTRLTGVGIEHVVAIIVWAAWASFVVSLAGEAAYAASGSRLIRLRMLTPMNGVTGLLIAAILAAPAAGAAATIAPAAPPVAVVAAPAPAVHTSAATSLVTMTGQFLPAARTAGADSYTVRVGTQHYTYRVHHDSYRVQKGDDLWRIADDWLGDGSRWHEIFHLNQGTYGHRMHGGDHIEPGWILVLPADAVPPPGATATTPPVHHPPTAPTHAPAPPVTSPTPAPGATAPHPGTHTPTPNTAPSAHPAPAHASARPAVTGVHLRDGDWLDLGLAAALVTAGTLVWAHRRRRYLPLPPSADPRLDDPDLAPVCDTVTEARRALYPPADPDATNPGDLADRDQYDSEHTGELASDQVSERRRPDTETVLDGEPESDSASDDRLDDEPVAADIRATTIAWPPAGLGLTGPGGESAARGFLVATLADRDNPQPEHRPQVVIPAGTLATLLGTDAVLLGASPRLRVAADLGDALNLIDRAVLTRTRMVYNAETDDLADLRTRFGTEDPLPPLLLIADAHAPHERTRIAAALIQGERLDIHGILLGEWPAGSTLDVTVDGTVIAADPPNGTESTGSRVTVLEPIRAANLLRTVIEADTGERQPTVVATDEDLANEKKTRLSAASPQDSTNDAAQPADHRHPPEPDLELVDTPADASLTTLPPAADQPDLPATPADGKLTTADDEDEDDNPARGPAQIRLLGTTPQIIDTPPVTATRVTLRPKAREILAYLLTHPGRVHDSTLTEEVLADERVKSVRANLNTYVYSLRSNLRAAAGTQTYLTRVKDGRWIDLDETRFDVDLWRMRHHLADAEHAPDRTSRITALRAAIAEYTGPFGATHEWGWAEPIREATRRQAIDAHTALADLLTATDPTAALDMLRSAIAISPTTEALYRQAMRIHAATGNIDGIRAMRRAVTRELAEIDATPDDDTLNLADKLIGEIKQRPGGSR